MRLFPALRTDRPVCQCACMLKNSAGNDLDRTLTTDLRSFCKRLISDEKIAGDKITLYVHPENHNRMRTSDVSGRRRHWILEIHFVDRAKQIGGFYEELLTVS